MNTHNMLKSGMVAGLLFIATTIIFPYFLMDYSSTSQTVSEIGQMGSPLQMEYSVMLYSVAFLSAIFCIGLWKMAKHFHLPTWPVYFVGGFALLDAGFALFPAGHSFHNVVGIMHLLGYMAPLAIWFAWKKAMPTIASVSLTCFVVIVFTIGLNLSPMIAPDLYPLEYYGAVQRSLLYAYHGWLVFMSMSMVEKHNREFGYY